MRTPGSKPGTEELFVRERPGGVHEKFSKLDLPLSVIATLSPAVTFPYSFCARGSAAQFNRSVFAMPSPICVGVKVRVRGYDRSETIEKAVAGAEASAVRVTRWTPGWGGTGHRNAR